MRTHRLQILGMAGLFNLMAAVGLAEDRVTSLHVEMRVAPDGSAAVSEVYTFAAAADDSVGTPFRRVFALSRGQELAEISAAVDGTPIRVRVERYDARLGVRLDRKDLNLASDEYNIELQYSVRRAVAEVSGLPELRWNAAGGAWRVPIERCEVRVYLPQAARAEATFTAYTGGLNANGRDFLVRWEDSGSLLFRSTRAVVPGEAFRIHLRFPGSAFALPQLSARVRQATAIRDALPGFFAASLIQRDTLWSSRDLMAGACVLTVFAYFIVAWAFAGRDPAAGPRVPIPQPPEGVSPAVMRYLKQLRYDAATFAVALISLTIKGQLRITRYGDDYEFEAGPESAWQGLPEDERVLLNALAIQARGRLRTKSAFAAPLAKASRTLEVYLESNYRDRYFTRNAGLWITGLGVSAIALVVAGYITADSVNGFGLVVLTLPLFFSLLYGMHAARRYRVVRRISGLAFTDPRRRVAARLKPLFSVVLLCALACVMGGLLALLGWPGLVLCAAAMAVIALAFGYWLPVRSRLGRTALDRIDGFSLFLASKASALREDFESDADRARAMSGTMAYAVALGVEDAWANHFVLAMQQAGIDRERDRGTRLHSRFIRFLLDPLGQRLDDAILPRVMSPGFEAAHLVGGRGTFSDAGRRTKA